MHGRKENPDEGTWRDQRNPGAPREPHFVPSDAEIGYGGGADNYRYQPYELVERRDATAYEQETAKCSHGVDESSTPLPIL